MEEILTHYGGYILIVGMIVHMILMRGRGGGCCGGHQHKKVNDMDKNGDH